MLAILHLLVMFVADIFKSRRRLEAENLFLRHQLNIVLRRAPPRLRLHGSDRALLVWMTRVWPTLLDVSQVVKPETILRWHRSGFKAFWRWKSRNRAAAYVPHNYPIDTVEPGLDETAFYDPINFTYPAGAYIAEIEIDRETGTVELVNFTGADDFGRIINR
jgi:hypothetical protein